MKSYLKANLWARVLLAAVLTITSPLWILPFAVGVVLVFIGASLLDEIEKALK